MTRPAPSCFTEDNTRAEGFSGAQIYSQMHSGPGTGSAQIASTTAKELEKNYFGIEARLKRVGETLGESWAGASADAAQAAANPISQAMVQMQDSLRQADHSISNQIYQFNFNKNQLKNMPASKPDTNFWDDATPWDTDTEDAVNSYNAEEDHNRKIYREFQSASNTNRGELPKEFPGVTADTLVVEVTKTGGDNGEDKTTTTSSTTTRSSSTSSTSTTQSMTGTPWTVPTTNGDQTTTSWSNTSDNTNTSNTNNTGRPAGENLTGKPPVGSVIDRPGNTGLPPVGVPVRPTTGGPNGPGAGGGRGAGGPGGVGSGRGGAGGTGGAGRFGGGSGGSGGGAGGVGKFGSGGLGSGGLGSGGLGGSGTAGGTAAQQPGGKAGVFGGMGETGANAGARGGAAAAAGRAGAAGMGGMGGQGQKGQGEDDLEHKSADYLITEENTNEIIGDMPMVAPPTIGG